MAGWKIPVFNMKYIFIHGGFSIAMLVFGGVRVLIQSIGRSAMNIAETAKSRTTMYYQSLRRA